jgi:hypothetical protein
MLDVMKEYRTLRIGQLLLKVGGVAVGLLFALIATLRDLFSTVEVEQNEDRRLHDSDLSGELNHRTGRLDSGLDPYGWYDRD